MDNFDFIKSSIILFNVQRKLQHKFKHYQKHIDASLFIENFLMTVKAQHGAPWFERFQHDKQNKQTTFLNEY
jgi:hypothetical protein